MAFSGSRVCSACRRLVTAPFGTALTARLTCAIPSSLSYSTASSPPDAAPHASGGATATASQKRPLYEGHVPLSIFQKTFMTVGSALASLHNPARGDMIATLSETSGGPFLPRLRDQMLESDAGRRLLVAQPSINSRTVDMTYLRSLPDGTFGKKYTEWLDWCRVTPDTRAPVQYVDDVELRYVMQRYRESHDFYHLMCLMPVSTLGETVVKYFEAAHFGLPVAFLSALGGPAQLSRSELYVLVSQLAPWAVRMGRSTKPLIGMHWEECWERDFEELRNEMGFTDPPIQVEYTRRRSGVIRMWPSKAVESREARKVAEMEQRSQPDQGSCPAAEASTPSSGGASSSSSASSA